MNAFNPTAFAASFVSFDVDLDSVEVSGNKITFALSQQFDADICVLGEVTGTTKETIFSFLPAGKISPEDEQEAAYPSLEVSNISICKVTIVDGVEAIKGMPFVLTDNQIGALNKRVDEVCELMFEREVEHCYCHEVCLAEMEY